MNFLKTIADKAKSAAEASPVRQLSGAGGGDDTNLGQNSAEQEGFICPSCMTSFATQELLQKHFEDFHLGAEASNDVEQHQSSKFGPLGLWNNNHGGDGNEDEEEKMLYKQQISALEEAKALLTSEVTSLRKRMSEMQISATQRPDQDAVNVDENKLLEKANELAAENVGLKAALDELTSEKTAVEERCKLLEKEEARRNTVDDAAVLKQELISVQKAMNDALVEKEEAFNKLFYEKQQLIDELEVMKKQVASRDQENPVDLDRLLAEREAHVRQELDKSVSSVKDELAASQASISQLETDHESLKSERDKIVAELANSTESLAVLNRDILALRQNLDKANNQTATLQEQVKRKEETLAEGDKAQEKMQQDIINLQGEVESLKSDLQQKTSAVEDSASKISELQLDLSRLQEERGQLMEKIEAGEGSNLAIQQLSAQIKEMETKLTNTQAAAKEKEDALTGHNQDLRGELANLKSQIQTEANTAERLTKTVDNLKQEVASLEEKCREAEEQALNKANLWAQTEAEYKHKLETTQSELLSEQKILKATLSEKSKLETRVQEADRSSAQLVTDLEVKTAELGQVKLTLEKFGSEFASGQSSLGSPEEILKLAREKILGLKVAVSDLEKKVELANGDIGMLKEAKHILSEDKSRLEMALDEKDKELSRINREREEAKHRISELESVISATENKIAEMRQAIEAFSGKEQTLLSDIEEKSKTISAIEKEKSSIVSNLASKESTLEQLLREKIESEKQLEDQKKERQAIEEQVCSMQSKWEVEREKVREELEELRTARQLLLTQIVELKEQNESDRVASDLKYQSMKEELTAIQHQLSESRAALEECQVESTTQKSLWESKENTFKKELSDATFKLEKVESDLSSNLKLVDRQQKELDSAGVERDAALARLLELEAAVAAAAEERRGLLERCLAAEGETDRNRNLTIELRRKMDDSQAALHELGRENQSLQVELMRQTGRKWKDDAEVTQCASCSCNFSLTNRKHHCRNCGNIFCNECSAKQAHMDGYKKAQRVCNSCFNELATK